MKMWNERRNFNHRVLQNLKEKEKMRHTNNDDVE